MVHQLSLTLFQQQTNTVEQLKTTYMSLESGPLACKHNVPLFCADSAVRARVSGGRHQGTLASIAFCLCLSLCLCLCITSNV